MGVSNGSKTIGLTRGFGSVTGSRSGQGTEAAARTPAPLLGTP